MPINSFTLIYSYYNIYILFFEAKKNKQKKVKMIEWEQRTRGVCFIGLEEAKCCTLRLPLGFGVESTKILVNCRRSISVVYLFMVGF